MSDIWESSSPVRLTDLDLPRIGARIGVGEDEIHAVLDVEARGSGYDSRGRVLMLRETYTFYRQLPAAKRAAAVAAGLATTRWVRNYPSDSYPDFLRMLAIDERAAYRSCSWGLGQIMGFNAELAGYETPQAMVAAFARSEANQLDAMVTFIVNSGLDDELRAHRWAAFAYGYNGPGYADNQYDVRLARTYAKWAKIPDTPYTPATSPADVSGPRPTVRRGDRSAAVAELQGALGVAADGIFGPATEGAVRRFQGRAGLVADGVVGPLTWAAIAKDRAARIAASGE